MAKKAISPQKPAPSPARKPAARSARPANPKEAPAKTVSRPRSPSTPATPAARPPAAVKSAPRSVKPAHPVAARPGHEAIALRAYFIAERRRAEGRCGEPADDWLAAERELNAEMQRSATGAKGVKSARSAKV